MASIEGYKTEHTRPTPTHTHIHTRAAFKCPVTYPGHAVQAARFVSSLHFSKRVAICVKSSPFLWDSPHLPHLTHGILKVDFYDNARELDAGQVNVGQLVKIALELEEFFKLH